MKLTVRKTRELLWFLKYPRFYPELFRRLGKARKLFTGADPCATQTQATGWCRSLAIGLPEAVQRITGRPLPAPVRERFPHEFAEAEERARGCPVPMGGPGNLDLLYCMADYLQAKKVVETGVAYGWSSLAILLSLKHRKGAKLISTDLPYPHRNSQDYVGCVVPEALRRHWRLLRLADREGLPIALGDLQPLDLCHYDSDKSYEGRMWAYPRLWNALRPGGCLISDDVEDNLGFHDFCEHLGIAPVIVEMPCKDGKQYAGILFKNPGRQP